mgnify:CR=1 FL=1
MGCLDSVFGRLAGLRLEELTLKLLSMTVSLFQLGFGKEGAVLHKGVICAGSVVLEVNEKRMWRRRRCGMGVTLSTSRCWI